MADLFADISQLGKLYYYHTYLFYDEPQLFSCFTPTLQYYFIVAIPSNDGDAWLAVPISAGRLLQLEQNKIEIREAFTEPESILWKLEESDGIVVASLILPSTLTDDLLPTATSFLDCCGAGYDPAFCNTINFCPNCGADVRGVEDG